MATRSRSRPKKWRLRNTDSSVLKEEEEEEEEQLPLEGKEKIIFEYDESDDDLKREDISFTGDSSDTLGAHPAGRSLSLDPGVLAGSWQLFRFWLRFPVSYSNFINSKNLTYWCLTPGKKIFKKYRNI